MFRNKTVCSSTNKATHPRCGVEGCPHRPRRATYAKAEWRDIMGKAFIGNRLSTSHLGEPTTTEAEHSDWSARMSVAAGDRPAMARPPRHGQKMTRTDHWDGMTLRHRPVYTRPGG
jgi:hypothetical protein